METIVRDSIKVYPLESVCQLTEQNLTRISRGPEQRKNPEDEMAYSK